MLKSAVISAAVMFLPVAAQAAPNDVPNARMASAIPQSAMTVTDWYKQDVYDPNDNKIGEIMDVLVDQSGTITALIVGVGGFSAPAKRTSPCRSIWCACPRRTTRRLIWS